MKPKKTGMRSRTVKQHKKLLARTTEASHGITVRYSRTNQAWLVMWHDQVLRVLPSEAAAVAYARSLSSKTSNDPGWRPNYGRTVRDLLDGWTILYAREIDPEKLNRMLKRYGRRLHRFRGPHGRGWKAVPIQNKPKGGARRDPGKKRRLLHVPTFHRRSSRVEGKTYWVIVNERNGRIVGRFDTEFAARQTMRLLPAAKGNFTIYRAGNFR